jgi:hypothetical protein
MSAELQQLFASFCAFGAGAAAGGVQEMDNAKFAKFTRDCKLLDKKLVPATVDITFSKVKDKAARKINFKQFDQALHHLAAAKGVTYEELVAAALAVGGPGMSGVTVRRWFRTLTDHRFLMPVIGCQVGCVVGEADRHRAVHGCTQGAL